MEPTPIRLKAKYTQRPGKAQQWGSGGSRSGKNSQKSSKNKAGPNLWKIKVIDGFTGHALMMTKEQYEAHCLANS